MTKYQQLASRAVVVAEQALQAAEAANTLLARTLETIEYGTDHDQMDQLIEDLHEHKEQWYGSDTVGRSLDSL